MSRNSMGGCLPELVRLEPLTAEQERALVAGWDDPGRRDCIVRELVERNARFAVGEALRFRGNLPVEDLIGAAMVGLCEASRRYDPAKGCRFISYAVWWIRQVLRHAVATQTSGGRESAVLFPTNVGEDSWRLALALEGEGGPRASDLEIAERLGWSGDRVARARAKCRTVGSLDAKMDPHSGHSSSRPRFSGDDLVYPEDAGPFCAPDTAAELEERRERLAAALARLNPREALILRLYYGLDGDVQETLQEIGERLGITRERVRQLRDKAQERLRGMLAGRALARQSRVSHQEA